MNIGERIASWREKKKLTQQQLGEKLRVTAKTVWRWENGEREVKIVTLQDIAKALNVDFYELIGAPTFQTTASTTTLPPQTSVPVFDISVGCGPDGWCPEEAHPVGVEYFDDEKVLHGSYALKTVGHSLEGDGIMEGDIVLVNPYQGDDIKPEWIMYVIFDGAPMLKHVIYHRSGAVELRGANPKESPRLIPPEMVSGYFTICGRVVSLKRNF